MQLAKEESIPYLKELIILIFEKYRATRASVEASSIDL